jgi:chemotaxis protein methyltransferase WspC
LQTQIEQILKAAIGLESASIGESTLDRSVRSRMRVCRLSRVEEYVERLRDSPYEMQQLIEQVVVPETWFFRDPETFQALAEWTTTWLAAAAEHEKLRLLSFGCCTGEEPYSIAMCLLDAGVAVDRFRIDAADISVRALEQARQGFYRQNSFRTEDLAFRNRYFLSTANGYQPAEVVRNHVRFVEGNLLNPTFPSEGASYHVIFCRNVLIYFDRNAQEQAMTKLQRALASGGILFAGPAESYLILQTGFASSGRSRGFIRERTHKIVQSKVHVPERRAPPKPPAPKLIPSPTLHQNALDSRHAADLRQAADLANSGRLAEAAGICRSYLLEKGPTAEAYYLLGLLLDAMDQKSQAADHYRKALYLEPEHVEALTQLALLAENMGDRAAAVRFRERIRRAEARTSQ